MAVCPTIKVKPWGKDQGDFVEINAEDYDPKVHRPLNAEEAAKAIAEAASVDLAKIPAAAEIADPMPPNPDDLVVPPAEQVANDAPPPEAPKPARKRRRRKARK